MRSSDRKLPMWLLSEVSALEQHHAFLFLSCQYPVVLNMWFLSIPVDVPLTSDMTSGFVIALFVCFLPYIVLYYIVVLAPFTSTDVAERLFICLMT